MGNVSTQYDKNRKEDKIMGGVQEWNCNPLLRVNEQTQP